MQPNWAVFLLATAVGGAYADLGPDIDFPRATAEQVSAFQDCFFLRGSNIVKMPASAFTGFRPDCTGRITDLGKLSAEQFANIPPSAVAAIRGFTLASLPSSAFSLVSAAIVGAFNYDLCSRLSPRQFLEIPVSSFGGFAGACTGELSNNVAAQFDPPRFSRLSPQAVGGFRSSISQIPALVFTLITAQQLQQLSTGFSSACGSLSAGQIANIPAGVWGQGITQLCLDSMRSEAAKAITADQLLEMPPAKIAALTVLQTKNLGPDACKGAQSVLLKNLNKDAFGGLTDGCWRSMDDEAVASLEDWQLYALPTAGFRGEQWKRLPAAKVTKIYGLTLNSLSAEACEVMSAEQLEAICRVAIAGLHYTCTAYLQESLGKSLDKDRASHLSQYGVRGLKAPFFRQISPTALSNFTGIQMSALSADVCGELRPLQLQSIPVASWANATAGCVSSMNPLLVEQLTMDHLLAMSSNGWSGFTAMHHHKFHTQFGGKFLEAATLDKIADNNPKTIQGWWRQAQCLDQMYDKGLLTRQDGEYSPNWMVLLSRPKSVGIQHPYLHSTLLAGLRGLDVFNISMLEWPYVPPAEFSTLSAYQFDMLIVADKLISVIRGEQLAMVPTKLVPDLSRGCLDRILGYPSSLRNWFSCAHVTAITEQQMDQLGTRAFNYVGTKLQWCAKPVNDTIAQDGDNGQRWSERKRGYTYELDCGIDPGKWKKDSADRAVAEQQFTNTYVEKQVKPATGCPCNRSQCVSRGEGLVCMEEPAATCQFVSGQSDWTGSPGFPSGRHEETRVEVHSSLSGGAIFGIVFAVLVVLAAAGYAAKRFNLHGKLRERWQYSRLPQMARI